MSEQKIKQKPEIKIKKETKPKTANAMEAIKVDKVVLNIGVGKDPTKMEKAKQLLNYITQKQPVETITKKRIPTWSLRPGLPIGCKITLRGKDALGIIPKILSASENLLGESCFDKYGNISFGIPRYIDMDGVDYNVDIGLMGMQATIVLKRAGFRVERRKHMQGHIPLHHKINKEQAIKFMKTQFNVKIKEEESEVE
ncbi:50S ribosomal protein L5 [Candidatus Woesearchaeota archaeon]|jgi:large subunit ribosomal protein L5|nr:50S ribosomal protein L5 [Candidatus Woesearchaeota archaeon]